MGSAKCVVVVVVVFGSLDVRYVHSIYSPHGSVQVLWAAGAWAEAVSAAAAAAGCRSKVPEAGGSSSVQRHRSQPRRSRP